MDKRKIYSHEKRIAYISWFESYFRNSQIRASRIKQMNELNFYKWHNDNILLTNKRIHNQKFYNFTQYVFFTRSMQ